MTKFFYFVKSNYSWILWFVATAILSFFIVHNAQWLIGDDAIIIKKTGSGIPFSIFDTIKPESGRFFPLAYYAYNILLLFNQTAVSIEQHYILVSIAFFIFSFLIFKLSKDILHENIKNRLFADIIALLFTFMIIQRSYTTFSHIFSTIWIDYLLLMVFIYYAYRFIRTKKTQYAILSFLVMLYCIFCIETIFILPLSFGSLLLIFNYKDKSIKEMIFASSLVLMALIFLLIYYFTVYRFTTNAYDGSHGAERTLLQNAVDMLLNQKLIIVALVVVVLRFYKIILKKENVDKVFDTLLLTGLAFALGSFILKLNWGMYYMVSVIFVGFPILYFTTKYLNYKYSLLILSFLSIFYVKNYPKNIEVVQKNRLETRSLIEKLKEYKEQGYTFVWRDEVLVDDNWDRMISDWKSESMHTLLRNEFKQKSFKFVAEELNTNNLYFFTDEYRKKTWDDDYSIVSENAGIIVATKK